MGASSNATNKAMAGADSNQGALLWVWLMAVFEEIQKTKSAQSLDVLEGGLYRCCCSQLEACQPWFQFGKAIGCPRKIWPQLAH